MATEHIFLAVWCILGLLTIPYYKPRPEVAPLALIYGATLWVIMIFDDYNESQGHD